MALCSVAEARPQRERSRALVAKPKGRVADAVCGRDACGTSQLPWRTGGESSDPTLAYHVRRDSL